MLQERLVSMTRRLDSSQPCKDPLFPGIRVRETDWPPLWPVQEAVGGFGTGQPGVLYPAIYFMQLCSKQAPAEEAAVAKADGKTSVPAQSKNSSCIEDGIDGGLRGVESNWWEVCYKFHFNTGEEAHDYNSTYRYLQRHRMEIYVRVL